MKWVAVEERLPPNEWSGLILTDVRQDKPVFAHVPDKWYQNEFPFADYFLGRWKESILISEYKREKAKVIFWLELEPNEKLYPKLPQ